MTPVERLKWYAVNFESRDLQVIIERMISRVEFAQAPGSTKKHHAYTGGLAEHTLEVVEYCNTSAKIVGIELNYDILIGAAIIHDWAKINDYTEVGDPEGIFGDPKPLEWVNTPYKYTIHHIAGSHAEFYRQAVGVLHLPTMRAIEHCILAHHGRQEWGSPVEPATAEALILHQADNWSAKFGPGKEKSVYVG